MTDLTETEADVADVLSGTPPPPTAPLEGEPLDVQIGGHVTEDEEIGAVYTAFARIPAPDEPEDEVGSLPPLAEIRLTFHEDADGASVTALFQLFVDQVDELVQRIDQARSAAMEAPQVVGAAEGDDVVGTAVPE